MWFERIIIFYYQNKKKLDHLFLAIAGVIVFLLFWFLPSPSSTPDKIIHTIGYVFAALSFIVGLCLFFGWMPDYMKHSYEKGEQMVRNKEKSDRIEKTPSISAMRKTIPFFTPILAVVILGIIFWKCSWYNIVYVFLFMAAYYCYKYISLNKN